MQEKEALTYQDMQLNAEVYYNIPLAMKTDKIIQETKGGTVIKALRHKKTYIKA